jgi:hypothetical protein
VTPGYPFLEPALFLVFYQALKRFKPEQRSREPDDAALKLLKIAKKHPQVFARSLRSTNVSKCKKENVAHAIYNADTGFSYQVS